MIHSVNTNGKPAKFKMHHNIQSGIEALHYKSGRIINTQGYILILKPDHPFSNIDGYVREHRLVMEQHLGRYLEPSEIVHHINEIKTDNRIENLALYQSSSEHFSDHLKENWNRGIFTHNQYNMYKRHLNKFF